MKKIILIAFLLISSVQLSSAQNPALAKLKFESAEESFSEGKYEVCIQKLSEAEKLFGKSNPPISHLKILATDKLLVQDTEQEGHQLEHMAILIKESEFYMKNYVSVSGAEEKTREVFKIQEKYESEISRFKKIIGFLTTVSSAQQGNAEAAYKLGELYEQEDLNNIALEWYLKSADKGNSAAMSKVAWQTIKLDQDPATAKKYVLKAIEKGNADAMYLYGSLLQHGYSGIPKDIPASINMYKKSSEKGDVNGVFALASIYFSGAEGISQDYNKALEYFTKAIEMGHYGASKELATMYMEGKGVAQDYGKALGCYKKILDKSQEIPDVYFEIGHFYKNGWGVDKNFVEALEWYKKGLKVEPRYDVYISEYIGELYLIGGNGLVQDYGKALNYFQHATGSIASLYYIGQMYEKGLGLNPNYTAAMEWYKKAATENYSDAMRSIGELYEKGLGVKKNKAMAQDWYQKADAAKTK